MEKIYLIVRENKKTGNQVILGAYKNINHARDVTTSMRKAGNEYYEYYVQINAILD